MKSLFYLLIILLGLACEAFPQNANLSNNKVSQPSLYTNLINIRTAIDSTWGTGLSTKEKLRVLDTCWQLISNEFCCFHDLNFNFDSLYTAYREEISNGVSAGRFQGMLSHMIIMLKESHSELYDTTILYRPIYRGTPIFAITPNYASNLGAALTVMPDSSLLVYKTFSHNPIGLRVGDIILGYDRIQAKQLVNLLINSEMPIHSTMIGSSPSSFIHTLLISVGEDWYLFDTIDVVRYTTGDTEHLSTIPLGRIFRRTTPVAEEIPMQGVPMPVFEPPTFRPQHWVTYGIIKGTKIGYIYAYAWEDDAGHDFFNAINALRFNTDGLIIDLRYNKGGYINQSDSGLSLLTTRELVSFGLGTRSSPNNFYSMKTLLRPSRYTVRPYDKLGYPHPIAVLLGPESYSAGDLVAYRLRMLPNTRFFGKPSSAAFNLSFISDRNGISNYSIGNDNFHFYFPKDDAFKADSPSVYMTHHDIIIDEPVWLTQEGVVKGIDDVVESAISWIDKTKIFYNH
jgi:hypothetical protein